MATVLVAAMAGTLSLSLAGFWRQPFAPGPVLALGAAAAALAWLSWRRPRLVAVWLGAGLAVALALPALHRWLLERWHVAALGPAAALLGELAAQALDVAAAAARGEFQTLPPLLAWACLGAVALGAALAITAGALGRGDGFWALAGGAALFGFQWVLYYEQAQVYLMAYSAAGLVLWAVAQAAHRRRRWQAEGRRAHRAPGWTAGVAATLGVVALAGLLPTHWAPVDLGGVAQRLREAWPALQQLRGTGAGTAATNPFGLRQVGFGGDVARLGGPAAAAGGVALRIQLDQPLPPGTVLYLRGSIHTVYTGHGWLPPSGEAAQAVPRGATLPPAVEPAVPGLPVRIRVVPVGLRTESLFHPLEAVAVEGVPGYQMGAGGNLLAPSPRAAPYTVAARIPQAPVAQVRALAQPAAHTSGNAPPDLQPYLQLPNRGALARDLQAVAALARQVAADRAHPVDQALALEQWLRTHFRYTLDVPVPPAGREFVAHFLLDLQEGYCTYYATALAVMLRTLGIPSRWVQGFVVVPGNATEVEVPNAQAHAWVEAYFPGYGWLTLDPTPRPDLPAPDRSGPPVAEVTPAPAPSQEEPAAPPAPAPRRERDPDIVAPQAAGVPREAEPWWRRWPAGILGTGGQGAGALQVGPLGAGALGATLAAALAGWRWAAGRRGRAPAVEVQQASDQLGRLMAAFGQGPAPHQTAREYAAALGAAWPELYPLAGRVATAYEAARYGPPGAPLPPPVPPRLRRPCCPRPGRPCGAATAG